eukprot:5255357-Pleurochrysis_carterae.AAC.1
MCRAASCMELHSPVRWLRTVPFHVLQSRSGYRLARLAATRPQSPPHRAPDHACYSSTATFQGCYAPAQQLRQSYNDGPLRASDDGPAPIYWHPGRR